MTPRHFIASCAATALIGAMPNAAMAQGFISKNLTDHISGSKGFGVINLLRDVTGAEFSSYLTENNGMLLLGADVNENNSASESSNSLGIAIKQAQLTIQNSAGNIFTFTDVFTSTTAQLRENGTTTPSTYHTMFGTGGSSNITGATPDLFDISRFDDVLWLKNIEITGEITRADLDLTFLSVPSGKGQGASAPTLSEEFFDFSGGFEDFAILSKADAVILENAGLGMANAPAGITYSSTPSVVSAIQEAEANNTNPAAPAPPLLVLAALGGLLVLKRKQ